jgi:membrane-associated phospholipid phosphatase
MISICFFAITLTGFTFFLAYAETRAGYQMPDPFMNLLPAGDMSIFIFTLTYSAVLAGILLSARKPHTFLLALQLYTAMTILRAACMFLLPLEPPPGTIHLNDPFLEHTFYMGRPNYKDLFFSGHTATVFLFGLVMSNKPLKYFFFTAAAIVGYCVIAQHVHYTIDVLAAPVMTTAGFYSVKRILRPRKIT